MRVVTWLRSLLLLGAVTAILGCAGSSDEPASSSTDAPSGNSAPTNSTADGATGSSLKQLRFAKPDETVREFLTSLKAGDQPRATSMLSIKAQMEMARTEAAIRPPGSPTAKFEVTEVEFLGKDSSAAHVLSVWTDQEEGVDAAAHEIVWILRKETTGWAIAGMATKVFEDQPPLILNFEDPLDAQRKRTAVDAEIARRNQTPGETTDADGGATKQR